MSKNLNSKAINEIILREVKFLNRYSRSRDSEFPSYCFDFLKLIRKIESLNILSVQAEASLREINKLFLNMKYGHGTYNKVNQLIKNRHEARLKKDYKKSDKIFEKLKKYDLELFDNSNYTYWEVKI